MQKSVNGKGQLDEKSYKYNCKKIEEKLFTDKQKSQKEKKGAAAQLIGPK